MNTMDVVNVVNVNRKFELFDKHWSPKIVGEINDTHVKLVKFQGEFVWHHHEREDELFFVVKGQFTMKLREGDKVIREGEFIIMPKGVEHCPYAEEEVWVMLLEPKTTTNTGTAGGARTAEPEWI